MPADDIAEVLRQLDKDKVDGLLRLLGTRKMEKVKNILGHREETAGGLMTSEFIGIPDDFTAEDAIAKLRQVAPDAETIYYLYVIDKNEVLRGVLSLRDLLVAHPQTPIANLMQTEVKQVLPKDGAKKVADCISKYNLFALPVVDAAGKILGIVTVDDVIDFILPPVAKRKKQILG
jgi:Mg/Co/Ni transporter MgtE